MSKFEGTVEEIIFRNEQNGWTVAAVRLDGSGRTSAVGVMPFLAAGEHAIFDGELVEHREYGEQIRVQSYETTRRRNRRWKNTSRPASSAASARPRRS